MLTVARLDCNEKIPNWRRKQTANNENATNLPTTRESYIIGVLFLIGDLPSLEATIKRTIIGNPNQFVSILNKNMQLISQEVRQMTSEIQPLLPRIK